MKKNDNNWLRRSTISKPSYLRERENTFSPAQREDDTTKRLPFFVNRKRKSIMPPTRVNYGALLKEQMRQSMHVKKPAVAAAATTKSRLPASNRNSKQPSSWKKPEITHKRRETMKPGRMTKPPPDPEKTAFIGDILKCMDEIKRRDKKETVKSEDQPLRSALKHRRSLSDSDLRCISENSSSLQRSHSGVGGAKPKVVKSVNFNIDKCEPSHRENFQGLTLNALDVNNSILVQSDDITSVHCNFKKLSSNKTVFCDTIQEEKDSGRKSLVPIHCVSASTSPFVQETCNVATDIDGLIPLTESIDLNQVSLLDEISQLLEQKESIRIELENLREQELELNNRFVFLFKKLTIKQNPSSDV